MLVRLHLQTSIPPVSLRLQRESKLQSSRALYLHVYTSTWLFKRSMPPYLHVYTPSSAPDLRTSTPTRLQRASSAADLRISTSAHLQRSSRASCLYASTSPGLVELHTSISHCSANTSRNPLDLVRSLSILIAWVPLLIEGYPAKFSGFTRGWPFSRYVHVDIPASPGLRRRCRARITAVIWGERSRP